MRPKAKNLTFTGPRMKQLKVGDLLFFTVDVYVNETYKVEEILSSTRFRARETMVSWYDRVFRPWKGELQ